MMSFVSAVDHSALANFVRDNIWVYPTLLTLHAIGLAFAAGVSVTMDLRVLGVASGLPLAPMRRLRPLFYTALAVNAISGVGLVMNNPAKWLVDPLFYAKLALLLLALIDTELLARRVFAAVAQLAHARTMAMVSLVLWAAAVTAGRLLAYPYFR